MVDDPAEGLLPERSLTDAGMAVLVRAAGVETVIEVDGAQARKADAVDEADERAELRHGLEPVDVAKAQTEPLQSKAGF